MQLPMETTVRNVKVDSYFTGYNQIKILYHYIFITLPSVKKMLNYWEKQAYKHYG